MILAGSSTMRGADESSDSVAAQWRRKINVGIEARVDFTHTDTVEPKGSGNGIYGRYLNVSVSGDINKHFSYSWRQRLNKFGEMRSDVFAATDWIWLRYAPNKNWAVAGGKQVVLIGGYEYDRAPIDIFFASRFWNNIACYQFGVSGTWTSNNGNHDISFQACNSPYARLGQGCYAYNLYWSGRMGCFSTLYSVNLVEYERGHYANLISLGNRIDFGKVDIEVDLMNRAAPRYRYFGHDFTVIGRVTYQPLSWLRLMAKGGYDEFKLTPDASSHVDNPFYGGGLEFYPLKKSRDLRVHAIYARLSDNEGTRYNELNIGVTWKVSVYSRK